MLDNSELVEQTVGEIYICCRTPATDLDGRDRSRRAVHLRTKDHVARVLFETLRDHVPTHALKNATPR